jgi:hypothetical protein
MAMRFEIVRDGIILLLRSKAAGRFRVVGFEAPEIAPEEVLDNDRLVMVYYKFGTFPTSRSAVQGPFSHEPIYRIEMVTSCDATGDLATLDNANSTDAERAAAIAAFKRSELLVNNKMDELWGIVYQIIMDARNLNLGISKDAFRVGSRWLDRFEKQEIQKGNIVSLTAIAELSCKISEPALGDTGTDVAAPLFDVELETNMVDSTSPDSATAGVIVKGS